LKARSSFGRWYCRYGISYRDIEQMMGERGLSIDHSTIYRWVHRYAPEIEKRPRWKWRRPQSTSWRVDETNVKFGANGSICTGRSTSMETRSTSISPRHGTPTRRTLSRQGAKRVEGLREAAGHQHGQSANLWYGDFYATIRDFEVMRALRKGQAAIFNLTGGVRGEARILERAFGIGAGALAEAVAVIGDSLNFQPA
jgi:IS6 family transposase